MERAERSRSDFQHCFAARARIFAGEFEMPALTSHPECAVVGLIAQALSDALPCSC